MNISSRRLSPFGIGLAAFFILTSARAAFVSDSFEYIGPESGTSNGVANMPISQYKSQPWGDFCQLTNYVWLAEAEDSSRLVNEVQDYLGMRPITGAATQLVLNLETNGRVLVRTNTVPTDFSASPVYVDALVKFDPFEEDPAIDSVPLKFAVYVNASSNLVVYHGTEGSAATASATHATVVPGSWHRLTVLLSVHPELLQPVFKVYLDGETVTAPAAYAEDGSGPVEDGVWFLSPAQNTTLNAISFQGTGMVDELVVTDNILNIWLALVFNDALLDVFCDGLPVLSNGIVQTGSTIAIHAADWHEIAVTGSCGCVTYTGPAGQQVSDSTGRVSAAHPAALTITAAPFSGGAYATGSGALDAGTLAAWAIANHVAEAHVASGEGWLDDYLMNVADNTNPDLFIDSATVSGDQMTLVVKATGGVNFTTLNGVINVWSSDDLETFTSSGSTYVTVTTESQVTVSVPRRPGQFLKVSVENADLTPAP